MKLLLVEDDTMIGDALAHLLKKTGHALDWARDGAAADTALRTCTYDAVVLDLGLPHRQGLDVLRALRARGSDLPVLVATARDAVADRVQALDAGADDYLVKPFDFDELLARLRALARRAGGHGQPVYRLGGIEVHLSTRRVLVDGTSVELTAREWMVLEALVTRPGQTLSRQQLEDRLYGWGAEIGSNTVEVYIHGVRRKLGNEFVRTVRGLGYQVPAP